MANPTAKIQCTINGVTTTIGEVALSELLSLSNALTSQQTIALNLRHPIKVDKNTAINLVTVQNTGIVSATVHIIEERK